ncbi:Wiskott-Aldrich syndrome protein member 1 [Batrachochytrium dendrobatidis]|nr:Wiskott-Aldrich syndrome protein member 1 [Batrachochytrium dendrobatidis]KAK5667886.1 Wiskott-Aldrich syndrome protein member 1 [Batrachochytrium dendrobatidis]
MSLPKRVLVAGAPSVSPFTAPSTAASMGVPEPTFIPALRQVTMMQLTRLFDQLSELSIYANEIFVDLANKTLSITERINNVNMILSNADADMELIEEEISSSDIKTLSQRERFIWKSEMAISSNFFVKKTQPASIAAVYNQCRPAPFLEVLDKYRNDGQKCMKFYSYPDFFLEEWRNLIKDQDGKKAKRKAKESESSNNRRSMRYKRKSESVQTKPGNRNETSPTDGNFISITISPNTRQHINSSFDSPNQLSASGRVGLDMGRVDINSTSMLQSMFETNIVMSKLPPPPPPPPPPVVITSMSGMGIAGSGDADTSLMSSRTPIAPLAGGFAPAATPMTPSVNFLNDIRTLQFKLKTTDTPDHSSMANKKKTGADCDEVAAILMRRVALEMSDSEEDDDGDDEDWG